MNMPMRHPKRSPRHATGMTLIEVLVTLVIISVGLLGVAALQLTTVRNNYDSFVRTQAATLAGDMLDRMRANRGKADQYPVDMGEAVESTDASVISDVERWRTTLAEQLPVGDGAIAYDDVTRIVTITIQWRERAESEDPNDRQLQFRTASQI